VKLIIIRLTNISVVRVGKLCRQSYGARGEGVSVCVGQREKERTGERGRERDRERGREMEGERVGRMDGWVGERERERESRGRRRRRERERGRRACPRPTMEISKPNTYMETNDERANNGRKKTTTTKTYKCFRVRPTNTRARMVRPR